MNFCICITLVLTLARTTLFRAIDRRTARGCKMYRGCVRGILRAMSSREIPVRKSTAFIRDFVESFCSAAKFTLLLEKRGVSTTG